MAHGRPQRKAGGRRSDRLGGRRFRDRGPEKLGGGSGHSDSKIPKGEEAKGQGFQGCGCKEPGHEKERAQGTPGARDSTPASPEGARLQPAPRRAPAAAVAAAQPSRSSTLAEAPRGAPPRPAPPRRRGRAGPRPPAAAPPRGSHGDCGAGPRVRRLRHCTSANGLTHAVRCSSHRRMPGAADYFRVTPFNFACVCECVHVRAGPWGAGRGTPGAGVAGGCVLYPCGPGPKRTLGLAGAGVHAPYPGRQQPSAEGGALLTQGPSKPAGQEARPAGAGRRRSAEDRAGAARAGRWRPGSSEWRRAERARVRVWRVAAAGGGGGGPRVVVGPPLCPRRR